MDAEPTFPKWRFPCSRYSRLGLSSRAVCFVLFRTLAMCSTKFGDQRLLAGHGSAGCCEGEDLVVTCSFAISLRRRNISSARQAHCLDHRGQGEAKHLEIPLLIILTRGNEWVVYSQHILVAEPNLFDWVSAHHPEFRSVSDGPSSHFGGIAQAFSRSMVKTSDSPLFSSCFLTDISCRQQGCGAL